MRIGSKPILFYSLNIFNQCDAIHDIILVVGNDDIADVSEQIVRNFNLQKVKKIIPGGNARQDSVFAGLKTVEDDPEIVVIHDGVRPFISTAFIEWGIQKCKEHNAVVSAVPVSSTIKKVEKESVVTTVDRSDLWEIQTPQIFTYDLIMSAYQDAYEEGFTATDDAMMVERLGFPVKILPGDRNNIKITTPEDLEFATYLIEKKRWPE